MRTERLYSLWIVVIAFTVVPTEADDYFWGFNDSSEGWFNNGSHPWKWSGNDQPDTSDISTFTPCPTGDYIWLQDNEDPPSTGTMVSATNITIYPNDIICITIYRHLKVYNRAENPRLNLVTDGGSHKQGLLWSYSYDAWDTVSLVCGQDESCCLTYPCTGYFTVNGEIDAHDYLIAVDNVGVNGGCSFFTNSTTISRPPSWCRNFDDMTVSSWSLGITANGWRWSGHELPRGAYPIPSGYFIWIENEEADTYSPTLQDISQMTIFTFQYYYYTNRQDMNNHVQVAFRNDYGMTTVWELDDTTVNDWTSLTVYCSRGSTGNCCEGGSQPCYGKFIVETFGQSGTVFSVGFDNFSVGNTPCT